MAARTKTRHHIQQEIDHEASEKYRTTQPWMNGWPRMSLTSVLVGSGVHCVACGRFEGVTCVAVPPDWTPPEKDPDWPFGQDNCPVCQSVPYA